VQRVIANPLCPQALATQSSLTAEARARLACSVPCTWHSVINTERGVETATQRRKSSGAGQSILLGFRRPHKGGTMKKQALTFIGVLSLLVAAGSAFAQTQTIVANVPFSFSVNRTSMPAGPYSISSMGNGGSVLLIRSTDGNAVKLITPNRTEALKPSERSRLLFHCYGGDHCFLYQIWVSGAKSGRELPKSSFENEVAANIRARNVNVIASTR
jgi:hypothetical protein